MRIKENTVTIDCRMAATFQNIIIRMPNWLGDIVMATPIIADVRRAWPSATITTMCLSHLCGLLIGNPNIDEIFSFSLPSEFLRRQEKRNLIARLRQGKYDLGILLPNSFSSAWWFWRGQIKKRIGFATDCRRVLLTQALSQPQEKGLEHLVQTYKRLLVPLGIPVSSTQPSLSVLDEERTAARQVLKQYGVPIGAEILGINPGAAYGSAKCWLPDRFRALTEKFLLEYPDLYILYFGDETGAPLIRKICQDLPPRVVNLAGLTTIRELIALIEQCSAFLTNDSGPMHIAASLKIPLVALFGSTNAVATGPYHHGEVIHKHTACSPCHLRTCPIDFRCMKQITVDEVYEKMQQFISKNNFKPSNQLISADFQ